MQKGALIKTSLFPRKIFMLSPGEEANGLVSGHARRVSCSADFHTARRFVWLSVPDAPGVACGWRYRTFRTP